MCTSPGWQAEGVTSKCERLLGRTNTAAFMALVMEIILVEKGECPMRLRLFSGALKEEHEKYEGDESTADSTTRNHVA